MPGQTWRNADTQKALHTHRTGTVSTGYKKKNADPKHNWCARIVFGSARMPRSISSCDLPCLILRCCHSSSPAQTVVGEAERADHTLADIDRGINRLYQACPSPGVPPSVAWKCPVFVIDLVWPIAVTCVPNVATIWSGHGIAGTEKAGAYKSLARTWGGPLVGF